MKQVPHTQQGERLRFFGAQRVPLAGNQCRVRVRLGRPSGGMYVATADGSAGPNGELQSAASATLEALRQAVADKNLPLAFRLAEVAPFEAFGKPGVMVSITAEHRNQLRTLLGFAPVDEDPVRSVAIAVLSATNRFLAVASGSS